MTVRRAAVFLALSCVTATLSFPATASSAGVTLSFVPTGIRVNPSGTRVVLWGYHRVPGRFDSANSSTLTYMALIDATTGRILADKPAKCRFNAVAIDDHFIYASVEQFKKIYALSLEDMSARHSIPLPDEPARELAPIGGNHLIATTQRGAVHGYSVPDMKEVLTLAPLAPVPKDPTKRVNIGAAAMLVVERGYARYQGVVHDTRLRGLSLMRPPRYMLPVDSLSIVDSMRRREMHPLAVNSTMLNTGTGNSCRLPDTSVGVSVHTTRTDDSLIFKLDVYDRETNTKVESRAVRRIPKPKQGQSSPRGHIAPVGKSSVVVAVGREVYFCDLSSHTTGKPPAKPRFVPAQTRWTITADRPNELRHTLLDVAPPIRAELMVMSQSVSIDPATAIVTVDGPVVMESALETLAMKFGTAKNPFAPASLQLQQYRALAGPYFKAVVGREPAGVPLLLPVDLQITDANDAKAWMSYYVFVDVPADAAGARIAKSETEAKKRFADPSAAPSAQGELISRADALVSELQKLQRETKYFEQQLSQIFEERSQLSGGSQ